MTVRPAGRRPGSRGVRIKTAPAGPTGIRQGWRSIDWGRAGTITAVVAAPAGLLLTGVFSLYDALVAQGDLGQARQTTDQETRTRAPRVSYRTDFLTLFVKRIHDINSSSDPVIEADLLLAPAEAGQVCPGGSPHGRRRYAAAAGGTPRTSDRRSESATGWHERFASWCKRRGVRSLGGHNEARAREQWPMFTRTDRLILAPLLVVAVAAVVRFVTVRPPGMEWAWPRAEEQAHCRRRPRRLPVSTPALAMLAVGIATALITARAGCARRRRVRRPRW